MAAPGPTLKEHYWTCFASGDGDILFWLSPLYDPPGVDIPLILPCCTMLGDPLPDIVFSMEMGHYQVDVASCLDTFCVFISEGDSLTHKLSTCLYTLSALLVLALLVHDDPAP
jgi:hypothetical protein